MALRKGQKELVENYKGGYCAVPAIPGGGKTYCLSAWATKIITEGLHKPGKLLIVTYMNSAVSNIKQRIAKQLEEAGIIGSKDYEVSTIHGLCFQIIKEKPESIFASEDLIVIDEFLKNSILNDAVKNWIAKNEERFLSFIDEQRYQGSRLIEAAGYWQRGLANVLGRSVSDFKARGITGDEAVKLFNQAESLSSVLAEAYIQYEILMKQKGYLDFDDMLFQAKSILIDNPDLLEKYQKKYTFVCEDEAQDSNFIQNEILTLIAQKNFLRVGDSNQAICGSFTSSDFAYFKSFCDRPDTKVYHITQSSRSSRAIINLANKFVDIVRNSHPIPACRESLLPQYIEPVPGNDARPNPESPEKAISSRIFNSIDEQYTAIIKMIKHFLKNHPQKTIAVLIPTSRKIERFVAYLENYSIPYELIDNSSAQRNRPLRLLGLALELAAEPHIKTSYFNLITEAFFEINQNDVMDQDYKSILINALQSIIDASGPEELFESRLDSLIEKVKVPLNERTANLIKTSIFKCRTIIGQSYLPLQQMIINISNILEFDEGGQAVTHKVASDLNFMLKENPRLQLKEFADILKQPKNLFSYFAGIVWELGGYEPTPGKITVSTYHKAKGLEWDVVFLADMNYSEFPVDLKDRFMGENYYLKPQFKNPVALFRKEMEKAMTGKDSGDCILASRIENISERTRLLYVGITRAKQYLYMCGYIKRNGERIIDMPSKYLYEIGRYLEEIDI